MAGGQEKTEQATPKRRRDERKKGNVFMSREVVTVFAILGVFFTLKLLIPFIFQMLGGGIERFWTQAAVDQPLGMGELRRVYLQSAGTFAICALPTLLVAGLVAIIFTFAQTKGLFAAKRFTPQFKRLNPGQGIKRIFSMRGLMELLKAILKIIVLGYVIYNNFRARFEELPRLMEMEFLAAAAYAGAFIMDIVTNVAIIFAFLAAADYMFQRWQYEKDLRMTKQEIKEEYKQTEGDPQIKAKIREKQRQMAMSRMMQNVPESDVIIRNPTHYAVAVRYDAEKNNAPVVLAKGADLVALRIIKTGEEHNVMIVENRPLARGLYETVALDREIPEEFYGPVAEVLAFVYTAQKKKLRPGTGAAPS